MEAVLTALFSMQTIIFCLAIYLAILVARRIIESIAKKIAGVVPEKWTSWLAHAWTEWILPISPVVLGGLLAGLVKQYPYPDVVSNSDMARIFYGSVCGWASAYVYRSAKALIGKVLPQKMAQEIDVKIDSLTPPSLKG